MKPDDLTSLLRGAENASYTKKCLDYKCMYANC